MANKHGLKKIIIWIETDERRNTSVTEQAVKDSGISGIVEPFSVFYFQKFTNSFVSKLCKYNFK